MTMKWEKTQFKSDMARARGLGSTKSGSGHWLAQRITAISNMILMVWAICSVTSLIGSDYESFVSWLSTPINAILMILFIISTFTHAVLGAQVVVEDYIHNEGFKLFKLIGMKLFYMALGLACIFSILKIAL